MNVDKIAAALGAAIKLIDEDVVFAVAMEAILDTPSDAFGRSVLGQLFAKGSISAKQRDAVITTAQRYQRQALDSAAHRTAYVRSHGEASLDVTPNAPMFEAVGTVTVIEVEVGDEVRTILQAEGIGTELPPVPRMERLTRRPPLAPMTQERGLTGLKPLPTAPTVGSLLDDLGL